MVMVVLVFTVAVVVTNKHNANEKFQAWNNHKNYTKIQFTLYKYWYTQNSRTHIYETRPKKYEISEKPLLTERSPDVESRDDLF